MTVREYIGARYVPLFMGDWDNTKTYEPLSIVLDSGNSYTSRQYVPTGVDITNETYWAETGNFNAQVEAYRNEVLAILDYFDDGKITHAHLGDNAVGTNNIIDGAVTADKIAANTIDTAIIVDDAITTAKIADSNVTTNKIADDSITTAKIADGNITTAKIADGNVTNSKIADGTITYDKLASNIELEIPDTIWNGTPVVRTLKEPSYGLQGMCVWPENNPMFAAIGKADNTNTALGAVDIYNLNSNTRIGTISGTFYHATDVTYYNNKLYLSAGGSSPILNIIDVTNPAAPTLESTVNFSSAGLTSIFGFGIINNEYFYLVESLYNNGNIYRVNKNTMAIEGTICQVPATSGLYQTVAYNNYFNCFMFISSNFSNIVFFDLTGKIFKTANFRKQYGFIPVGELEAVCSIGKSIYFNNNPTETKTETQVLHGAIWKCDFDNNFNNTEYITRYAQNQVYVVLTNSASGLNNENTQGNQFAGINATYPITLKYPEDLPAISMLTDNRIELDIKNNLTGIIPIIGGNWFVAYDDGAQSYKIPGIYVQGANATFSRIAQVPVAYVEQTISSHKVLVCARDSRVAFLNSFATDVSSTAYICQVDVNAVCIHPSEMNLNNLKVVNGGVSIVSGKN